MLLVGSPKLILRVSYCDCASSLHVCQHSLHISPETSLQIYSYIGKPRISSCHKRQELEPSYLAYRLHGWPCKKIVQGILISQNIWLYRNTKTTRARALIFGKHLPWVAIYQDCLKHMAARGLTIFHNCT